MKNKLVDLFKSKIMAELKYLFNLFYLLNKFNQHKHWINVIIINEYILFLDIFCIFFLACQSWLTVHLFVLINRLHLPTQSRLVISSKFAYHLFAWLPTTFSHTESYRKNKKLSSYLSFSPKIFLRSIRYILGNLFNFFCSSSFFFAFLSDPRSALTISILSLLRLLELNVNIS